LPIYYQGRHGNRDANLTAGAGLATLTLRSALPACPARTALTLGAVRTPPQPRLVRRPHCYTAALPVKTVHWSSLVAPWASLTLARLRHYSGELDSLPLEPIT